MKNIFKRGLSMVLVLVLCLGVLSGISIEADAAGNWLYNWGTRGDVASKLSDAAESFYANNDTSYAYLSSLSGSSNLSTVASSSLYLELQELMKSNHDYINNYDASRPMFAYTDCQNGGGKISSFYSGKAIGPSWDSGSTWNREHTWPNSKGLAGADENDIMMLRPTHKSENGGRSNTAYGESTGYYDPNTESNGALNLHGDVARIFLYVYVRWGNVNGNGQYSTWGTKGVMESKEVLLKWMAEDPVDTWELGRNDSVESITGTRNVFVDYPELAFLLFGEEVPAGLTTPSGAADSGSYTVTATSNNDAYGTVTVSGKVITATPAAGYEISGYEVTSGTATVTQSGRTFVVSAASDCNVQINFAAKASTGISFIENGTVAASYTVTVGDSITLPTHNGTVPEGYSFVGWSNGLISDTTSRPSAIFAAGESYTVGGTARMYAVYSYEVEGESGGESTPATTTATVTIGDYAAANSWANDKQYFTMTIDPNVTVTAAGGKNTGKYFTSDKTWRMYQTDSGTFTVAAAEGYIIETVKVTYKAGNTGIMTYGGSNFTSNATVAVGASSATFGVRKTGTDGKTNGQVKITAIQVVYSRDASAGPATVTHYTTIGDSCQHTDSTFVEGLEPTCTTSGWTDGLYCNTCQIYVYGHEEAPATGHATATWHEAVPASCTTYGIRGHYHCNICDSDYLEKTASAHTQSAMDLRLPINPDAHDSDTEIRNAKDATCTETGYTGDTHCLGCQAKITAGTVIPKQAHTVSLVTAADPTHADDGWAEHYGCSVCGKFFTDETGTTELPAADVLIPALGHSFGEFQKDANKHWKECSCGVTGEEGEHTYGAWTTTKKPGVGVEGSKERSCTACGYKQTDKIPATTSPATGDSSMIGLWVAVMILSACTAVTLFLLNARKRAQK